MSTNLVIYFKEQLHQSSAKAAKSNSNWGGTCYLTPLIGAFVADAYLGRYKTIASFSIIYVIVSLFAFNFIHIRLIICLWPRLNKAKWVLEHLWRVFQYGNLLVCLFPLILKSEFNSGLNSLNHTKTSVLPNIWPSLWKILKHSQILYLLKFFLDPWIFNQSGVQFLH